jgi:hypothetical protein
MHSIYKEGGEMSSLANYRTTKGKFLGFTATNKNIYYLDRETEKIKTATQVIFDEANYTLPKEYRPPAYQELIDLGYAKDDFTHTPESESTMQQPPQHTPAHVQLLTPN